MTSWMHTQGWHILYSLCCPHSKSLESRADRDNEIVITRYPPNYNNNGLRYKKGNFPYCSTQRKLNESKNAESSWQIEPWMSNLFISNLLTSLYLKCKDFTPQKKVTKRILSHFCFKGATHSGIDLSRGPDKEAPMTM